MALEIQVRFPVNDAELSSLHRQAFSGNEDGAGVAQEWARRLERHSLTWAGAFDDGVLVGFVHAVWDGGIHAFILDTAVRPDLQRTGIGRTLVQTVTEQAFAAGCEWVHVDYDEDFVDFYEKSCGFRPTPAGLRSSRDG